MKRFALIIMTIATIFVQQAHAQYYSVNFDAKTVAAMVAAYGTGTVAEAYYDEQVQAILKHYKATEVATAGIFASKFLERKAFTDLGIWSSATENYYYRRIYHLVAHKIIPKTWIVAKLMLRSPQTALHWGSYLMKVCDDTKALCMQFESIVTNSTLSFSDIAFLEFNEEIAAILKLSEIGNVDWERLFDDLSKVPGNVAGLFKFSDYNLTSWITDYLDETSGSYYTQRWYIARRDRGSVPLCDYMPPTDDKSILEGGEWTRFKTSDPNFYPNASQREQALSNSERYAGWSRNRVQQLNNANDGFNYAVNYYQSCYIISRGGKQTKKAYAYEIHVTKSWDNEEVVYEDLFDSYSMDLNTFKAQLNVLLSEFNENEDGYVYYIASDSRNYYQATNEEKLKGCETVTISVTCSDGATLGQGTTQYKCRKCGKTLNAHSKECAMKTTAESEELDLSELDAMQREADNKVYALQSQISALEKENESLIKQIANASVEDAIPLRQKYNENKAEIERLKPELATWQQKQAEIAQAKEEAKSENDVATDDYYRIPAIMQDCKTAYNITWQDNGSWNGYTFIRKGTIPNINGIITFRATLKIARKPKYFLGIKIHRAILQISWDLTTEYSDTHVVEVMTLDPGMSEKEKAKLVNDRIAEIAKEYPKCKITTEYARTAPQEDTKTSDMYHLLWSSDRLEIAREVDSRLTKIYADLVSLEKMMHYKRSIIDVLKDVLPPINDEEGRRLSLVEECHDRWMENARNKKIKEGKR